MKDVFMLKESKEHDGVKSRVYYEQIQSELFLSEEELSEIRKKKEDQEENETEQTKS